jgi:hypothetical protein
MIKEDKNKAITRRDLTFLTEENQIGKYEYKEK